MDKPWRSKMSEGITRIAPDGLNEGVLKITAQLEAVVHRKGKEDEDLGVISRMIVSNIFKQILSRALAASAAEYAQLKLYKYHEWGTNTTAEAATQNGCITPAATTVNTTGTTTLDTGTQAYTTSSYITVATLTAIGSVSITEHCPNCETTAGGLGLDRSLFTAIPLVSGDSITFTYTLNISGT